VDGFVTTPIFLKMQPETHRLSPRKQIIEEHFDCDPCNEGWKPRFNVAPASKSRLCGSTQRTRPETVVDEVGDNPFLGESSLLTPVLP
jgi:hypothetical protein